MYDGMDTKKDFPVKEGDVIEVVINNVGGKGDGIARVGGYVIFVPGTRKGDRVKIKINKLTPKAGFAEVVKKLERKARPKYIVETVNREEEVQEEVYEPKYEDTEDFGEDDS